VIHDRGGVRTPSFTRKLTHFYLFIIRVVQHFAAFSATAELLIYEYDIRRVDNNFETRLRPDPLRSSTRY